MSAAKELHPQFVVDRQGHKKAVILPFEEYEELLEDLADLAAVAERSSEETITHNALKNALSADGSI